MTTHSAPSRSGSSAPRPNPIHRREIRGGASLVVPRAVDGSPDWQAFASHLDRCAKLGLSLAISMTPADPAMLNTELQVGALFQAKDALSGTPFYAGVHVLDQTDDWFNLDRYRRQLDVVVKQGGTPVIFPSWGLASLQDQEWLKVMAEVGRSVDRFYVADLGPALGPYGPARSMDAYIGLLRNQACAGIVHGSLSRLAELDRMHRHAGLRPDFHVLSMNERAVDMAVYGSDYLLLTAGMAPDLFVRRDRLWAEGDRDFYELNDVLQYLGMFTSRRPLNAQAHSVLQFLELRGWVATSDVPNGAAQRPSSDRDVLRDIAERLGVL